MLYRAHNDSKFALIKEYIYLDVMKTFLKKQANTKVGICNTQLLHIHTHTLVI